MFRINVCKSYENLVTSDRSREEYSSTPLWQDRYTVKRIYESWLIIPSFPPYWKNAQSSDIEQPARFLILLKLRSRWNAVRIAKSPRPNIFIFERIAKWWTTRVWSNGAFIKARVKGGDVKQEVLVRSPILRSLSLSCVQRNFGKGRGPV